jgi:hypothetical protein
VVRHVVFPFLLIILENAKFGSKSLIFLITVDMIYNLAVVVLFIAVFSKAIYIVRLNMQTMRRVLDFEDTLE